MTGHALTTTSAASMTMNMQLSVPLETPWETKEQDHIRQAHLLLDGVLGLNEGPVRLLQARGCQLWGSTCSTGRTGSTGGCGVQRSSELQLRFAGPSYNPVQYGTPGKRIDSPPLPQQKT